MYARVLYPLCLHCGPLRGQLLFALSRDGTDPVLLAREWSKNVEYCPANLDRLDLAVQKLSASSLLGMLVSL